jgi:hypothetical protein
MCNHPLSLCATTRYHYVQPPAMTHRKDGCCNRYHIFVTLFRIRLRLCLQDGTSVRESMQPLLLWHTGMWAAMHACYWSGKRGDLVNLSERLALCLVMLALVPGEARHKRTARLNALARKEKRAALHRTKVGEPQHVFFKAYPSDNLPPQVGGPAHETLGCCSDPGQDKTHSSPHQQAPCTACAVLCTSPCTSLRQRKQTPVQASPVTSDNEPELLSCSPSYNSTSANSSLGTPKEMSPLASWALLGTQQGVDDKVDSHAGKFPYSPAGKNSSGVEGAQAPSPSTMDVKSGSLFVVDPDRSPGSSSRDMSMCPGKLASADMDSREKPGAPPLPGDFPRKEGDGEQAGTDDQLQQRMQNKRKAGPAGGDGVTCKLRRQSERQQVSGLLQPYFRVSCSSHGIPHPCLPHWRC